MKTSLKSDPLDTWIIWVAQPGEVVGVTLDRLGWLQGWGVVPPSSPKALSGLGERGSGLSTSATPLLWVGAYPLVTLLLRLTLLAYPLGST